MRWFFVRVVIALIAGLLTKVTIFTLSHIDWYDWKVKFFLVMLFIALIENYKGTLGAKVLGESQYENRRSIS